MFSYSAFLFVAVQLAAGWGCTLPAPDTCLPSPGLWTGPGSCGSIGGDYTAAVEDAPAPAPADLPESVDSGYIGDNSYAVPQTCTQYRLVPVVRPVVEECLTQVPVVTKSVRHQTETFTRHVPVTEKVVSQQEEKIVRHVPVTQKSVRNVVETRTRHVPVVKSRTRTVVEPYTTHVPVTEKYTRPIEETIVKSVPVVERRTVPVVSHKTRYVPVTEKRTRPVVSSVVTNVPVKQRIVKNIVEQRAQPFSGPCSSCGVDTDLATSGLYQGDIEATDIDSVPTPAGYIGGVGPYTDLPTDQYLDAPPAEPTTWNSGECSAYDNVPSCVPCY